MIKYIRVFIPISFILALGFLLISLTQTDNVKRSLNLNSGLLFIIIGTTSLPKLIKDIEELQ